MRNKMRTLATGIAVASGIFLLIVLLGAGNGIIHTLEENSEGLALDAVHVWPGSTSKPFDGMKEGRPIKLETSDERLARKQFSRNVENVASSIEASGKTAAVGKQHLSVTVKGVSDNYQQVERVQLIRGRFINNLDLKEKRKVIVIVEDQEDHLFGEKTNAIGQTLRINGIAFLVVGITKKDFSFGNNEMLAPFTTIQSIYGDGHHIDQLSMKVQNLPTPEANTQFEKDYRAAMGAAHDFAHDDERAIWIWNTAEDNATLNQAKGLLNTAFWVLGLLTLLSGVVGVSNIMLIAVKERTHEFGIRKAIGARPWSIIRMVMLESVVITTFFGYIGMVLGVAFCEWMDASVGGQTMDIGVFQQKYFVDPTVDLGICIRATLVMIIAGALAGFFPARRAAHVKPIEALRE